MREQQSKVRTLSSARRYFRSIPLFPDGESCAVSLAVKAFRQTEANLLLEREQTSQNARYRKFLLLS